MFNNGYFLVIFTFFILFLAILIGIIVAVFLDNRFLRMITTVIMTASITLLILWTNIRISGKVDWFSNQLGVSSTNSPTDGLSDS